MFLCYSTSLFFFHQLKCCHQIGQKAQANLERTASRSGRDVRIPRPTGKPSQQPSTPADLRDDKQFFIDHPGAVPITTHQVLSSNA
ncbi:hypothetical protein Bca101_079600 [Brassica carinata]